MKTKLPDPMDRLAILRRYLHVLALLQNNKDPMEWSSRNLAEIITKSEGDSGDVSDKTIRDYIRKNLVKEMELDIKTVQGSRKTELGEPLESELLEQILSVYASFVVNDEGRSTVLRQLLKRHPYDCLWILGRLYFSIIEKKTVSFEYRVNYPGYDDPIEFTVHPYYLVMRNNNLYLVAFNPYNETTVLFIVNKIENLKVNDSVFHDSIPRLDDIFPDPMGSFIGTKYRVKLRIAKDIKDRIDQGLSIVEPTYSNEGNDCLIAAFSVSDGLYLCSWLFQFGSNVEILAPSELRQMMGGLLRECSRLYKEY